MPISENLDDVMLDFWRNIQSNRQPAPNKPPVKVKSETVTITGRQARLIFDKLAPRKIRDPNSNAIPDQLQ